jgi:hypothetical protein
MAGQLTIDTLKASSGVLATQNGMTGIAKAWVHWTQSGSTPTVDNSFNVSSITRTASGEFSISFTTALSTANSVFSGFARINANGGQVQCVNNTVFTTTALVFGTTNSGGTFTDPLQGGIVVFSS